MELYLAEKPLLDKLSNKATSSIAVPIKISLDDSKKELFLTNLSNISKSKCDSRITKALASLASLPHPDLTYGSAILASTVMNLNDDVFLPQPTWDARLTAINTPYNNEHIETNIIGHIIASRALAQDGTIIPDSATPPDYFDVEVDFVAYRSIYPDIVAEIVDKAPKGERFVSMEAIFEDFDYALVDSNKNVKIIGRNESTAFLTKYLRVYGGEGYYRDQKIGRVLKNFRFVGMGNVDAPANTASEYTKINTVTLASAEEQKLVMKDTKKIVYFTKGNIMKIETLDQAVAEIERLQAEVQTLQATKSGELSTEKAKTDAAVAQTETLKQEKTAVAAELETTKNELKAKIDELTKIYVEKKFGDRLADLKNLGFVTDNMKKEEITSWTDEQFNSVTSFAKNLKETVKSAPVEKTEAEKIAEAAAKAKEDLAKAEADKEKALETTQGEPPVNQEEQLKATATKLVETIRASKNKVKKN